MNRSATPRPAALLLALAGLCATLPASAGVTYTITLAGNSQTSPTPFQRSDGFPISSSNSASTYTGHGAGSPGSISALSRVDTDWWSGLSGGAAQMTRSSLQTDDLVITGPAGSVTGTLHLLLSARFARTGGFENNGGHSGSLWINVTLPGTGIYGGVSDSNGGSGSSYGLTGLTGPIVDHPIDVTGTWTANTPFTLSLMLEMNTYTYGNVYWNPGMSEASATLRFNPVGDGVMTLPAGYTFSSPSMGVSNNSWQPIVAVAPTAPGGDLSLRVVGENPSAGGARLAFSTPRAGHVRVALFDLAGRCVRVLVNEHQDAGERTVTWDGRADDGSVTAGGVYFVRAELEGRSIVRRVVRTR